MIIEGGDLGELEVIDPKDTNLLERDSVTLAGYTSTSHTFTR